MGKMNPEVKAAWLKALRSGEYEQGSQQLKTEEGTYCCLGVLCDISKRGEWDANNYYKVTEDDWASTLLPDAIREWAGLNSIDPSFDDRDEYSVLSHHNDSGVTFEEIADLIEQNF